MRIAIAGGGPVGAFLAIGLARRGHSVLVIDRDPGPPRSGDWTRVGVMQFDQPHGFRSGARLSLIHQLPDVYQALLTAGSRIGRLPQAPDESANIFCRRSVFESTLREAARRQEGVDWRTGHVDDVIIDGGIAGGLVVDGVGQLADVVVVATGKNSHLGDALRGPAEGGLCGFSSVSRSYRSRNPGDGCDLPVPSVVEGPDYLSMVMPSDSGHHSLLFTYPASNRDFRRLRDGLAFDRAAAAVPNLSPWRDPARYEPVSDPVVAGNLTNTYRHQGPARGVAPASGLFFIGDAVTTLNPAYGLYLSLAFPHAVHLMARLADPGSDFGQISAELDEWAEQHIYPWYLDHVRQDESILRRLTGGELDLAQPVTADVVCSAAAVDPTLMSLVGPYLALLAGPDILDGATPRVRRLLADGWRPIGSGPPSATVIG